MVEQLKPFTVKPNMKKVFAFTTIKVVSVAIPILLIAGWMIYLIGPESFQGIIDAFSQMGFFSEGQTMPSIYKIMGMFALGVAIVTVVFILLTYISYRKRYFTFELQYAEVDKERIPYEKVVKINYDRSTLADVVFKTGTLSIDMTGTEKKELSVEFIDNVEAVVSMAEKLKYQYQATKYAQYAAQKRVDGIMDRF